MPVLKVAAVAGTVARVGRPGQGNQAGAKRGAGLS